MDELDELFKASDVAVYGDNGADNLRQRMEVVRKFMHVRVKRKVRAAGVDFSMDSILVLTMRLSTWRPNYR